MALPVKKKIIMRGKKLPQATREEKIARLKQIKLMKIELQKKMLEWKRDNVIEFFDKPPNPGANPKQAQLLEAFKDPLYKILGMSGGNRLGKCQTAITPIQTPKGTILMGDLYADRKPFKVYAWDGKQKVVAKASAPFKKFGLHQCYRIGMSDGRWVEAADHHRILTQYGWISTSDLHDTYFPNPLESSSGTCLSVRERDASHLMKKAVDFQGDYRFGRDLCGGQLRLDLGNVQGFVPLLSDARQLGAVSYDGDVRERRSSNSLSQGFDLLSIQDAPSQNEDLFVVFLCCNGGRTSSYASQEYQLFSMPLYELAFALQSNHGEDQNLLSLFDPSSVRLLYDVLYKFALSMSVKNQADWQSRYKTFSPLLPNDEFFQGPYIPPVLLCDNNKVDNITPIPSCQEVFDFEVERYHNYFAGGLIHHNTTILTIIGLSVLFGKYIWSDESLLHLFPHKKPRKVRYVGQGWQDHIKAVVVPEIEKWWPKARQVEKHGNGIITDTFWKDVKTGGTIEVMSNNQRSKEHEGWSGDLILYDEPPRREIYVANARGLVDRRGREIFAATLLDEPWIDREIVKKMGEDGKPDKSVFWVQGTSYDNVGYGITEEGIDELKAKLTEGEIQARIYGIPQYMQGLVYPQFSRKIHLFPHFNIPLHWMVDIGIDVHPRERQAVLFVATDPRNERYICDEIWDFGDGTQLGDMIVRKINQNSYRINRIIIDPLSKGDSNNPETTYQKVFNVLARYGLPLETASKDKDAGILEVKKHLHGPNDKPSIFFLDNCVRTLYEIEGYMWNKETQKPVDRDDHFLENLYRICLLGTQYIAPEDEFGHEKRATGTENRNSITGY